jgi:hypothetical protein
MSTKIHGGAYSLRLLGVLAALAALWSKPPMSDRCRGRSDRERRGHSQPAPDLVRTPCLWFALRDADPVSALDALRRGGAVAHDSGNRYNETNLVTMLCRLEADHGEPSTAFEYVAVAIRRYQDSGNTTIVRIPLAVASVLSDRLGRYESAATIAGFAVTSPLAALPAMAEFAPRLHLRNVLGDQTYESLARKGAAMTTAAMATYAYDQIDQARTELNLSRNRRDMRV